ncbi:MAG: NTPase [Verrucomicrobia bacterium]|nr:NTPase [Verrucomicrobiota bacterium]
MNILLTGTPGVGKTTLIRKLVEALDRPARGIITEEVRVADRRRGFRIVTLDGREGVLAHDTIKGPNRVSRYGVTTAALESLGIPAITPTSPDEIIVIDEIGKMECVSQAFKDATWRALEAPNLVLGTIARKGVGFIARVKARPDVTLFEVTPRNRDHLSAQILHELGVAAPATPKTQPPRREQ